MFFESWTLKLLMHGTLERVSNGMEVSPFFVCLFIELRKLGNLFVEKEKLFISLPFSTIRKSWGV